MTPTEIETAARSLYNAVNDTFWTQSEILNSLYKACQEMARLAINIEGIDSSTSTAIGTQSYSLPTNTIALKRLEYNGAKLQRITLREDDSLTNLNQTTVASGTPIYYYEFNNTVFLRPIPDAVGTLKFYVYKTPAVITSSSTLEIPIQWHNALVDFVVAEMAAKDNDIQIAGYYMGLWRNSLLEARKWQKKMKRGDSFAVVKDGDKLATTVLGYI